MEGYSNLKDYERNPLISVSCEFTGTKIKKKQLTTYLKPLLDSRTVGELQSRLESSSKKLFLLNTYNSCDIEIHPGDTINSALVHFYLTEKQPYGLSFGISSNPLKFYTQGFFRNINSRANTTKLSLAWNYLTKKIDIELDHLDKLTVPGRIKTSAKIGSYSRELDTNITENSYGPTLSFQSKAHQIEIGRRVRSNIIKAEHASESLIRNNLLPTDKNYLAYDYTKNFEFSKNILNFKVQNEIAVGENLQYHKITGEVQHFLKITPEVVLENKITAGIIPSWSGSKYYVNDTFRYENFKGFSHLGRREQSHNQDITDKIKIAGDDLGNSSKLSLESKLYLSYSSFLKSLSLTPYLFISGAYINEKPSYYQNLRGSTGFGLTWVFGGINLEFAYSLKVFKQENDREVDFQVFFTEKESDKL
jgi:outer membrane protein assembly factor BamA